jgi:hypothetical protein
VIFANYGGHLRQVMSFNQKKKYSAHIVAKKIKLIVKFRIDYICSTNKFKEHKIFKITIIHIYNKIIHIFHQKTIIHIFDEIFIIAS